MNKPEVAGRREVCLILSNRRLRLVQGPFMAKVILGSLCVPVTGIFEPNGGLAMTISNSRA